MLKKRILASSLASVMALSSVSVVAFADETATADYSEVVTKAELKEIVKAEEKFADDELDDYGTIMSENFENALEAARVVVENADATTEDATAAYQMLMAVKAKLVLHTTEELSGLVEDYQKTYDTKNILNAEFNDEIYSADSFKTFKSAFETAKDSLEETDQRVINDAYADLEAAIKGLSANPFVKKAEFRSVYTKYIELVNGFDTYEEWRRGKATVGGNDIQFAYDTSDKKVVNLKDKELTFAELKAVVYGTSNTLPISVSNDAKYGAISADTKHPNTTWLSLGAKTNVADDAKAAYDLFITNSNSDKTTLGSINTTYASMKKAIEIFDGWVVDDLPKSGSRSKISRLLDDKHEALVKELIKKADTTYDAYVTAINSAINTEFSVSDAVAVEKKDGVATGKIIVAKDVPAGTVLLLDSTTGLVKYTPSEYADGTVKVAITKDDDITKYMPLDSTLVGTNLDTAVSADSQKKTTAALQFSKVLKLFEVITAHEDSDAKEKDYVKACDTASISATLTALDTREIVTSSSTASVVYPIIYRAMAYALNDMFPTPDATYKKSDVAKLITASNALIEETGDASIFKLNNIALDTARKNATAWLAAANATKGYDDANPVTVGTDLTYTAYSGMNATQVKKALQKAYDDLSKQAKALPVSFGDIAEAIADAAEGIDNGVYGDSVKNALAEVAFDLSTLKWTEKYEAYDDDLNYVSYNRLKTDGNDGEKAFYTKYQALVKAMEEAEKAPDVVLGDLDGDKVANAKDALMIVQAAVGLITLNDDQKAAADFNNDGKVNSDDALAIVKAALGLN